MIVLTGGAGFIGSCILAKLNESGLEDILVVDHIDGNETKKKNLSGKAYSQYQDKAEFIGRVRSGQMPENVEHVIHMGACSSTILNDPEYYEQNNFEYSKTLAQWAMAHEVRFIYASSAATYGDGSLGYSDDDALTPQLKPLNYYGESKQKFDCWILEQQWQNKVVGLKFFNVFGPNEYHKGQMRSVINKAYQRVAEEGVMALFKSYRNDFGDGEQKRDFIYVKDTVDVVMFFLRNMQINGIFNVGTGVARTWNDVALSLFSAVGRPPNIQYIDMPESIKGQYQYFTQAEMGKLRKSGYSQPFTPLEDAVRDYAGYLKNGERL